jgi:hypothetical protein
MSDRTLAIVFRNPNPQRSPIRTELYLFRRNGSSTRINYANENAFHRPEEATAPLLPHGIR